MAYPLMAEEFPDFDQATLPAIPADWTDTSWHNDAAPSFETPEGLNVYIDFADPAERESSDDDRFGLSDSEDRSAPFASSDWDAILAEVERRKLARS